jgi:hypothetical protein
MGAVDRSVFLKGRLTQLEDGTKIASLKDSDFFNGSLKRLVPEPATANITDGYVRDVVYKAFVSMNCLEFTALGCNYYSAPDNYKALMAGGRNIVVGASDSMAMTSPTIHLTIRGRQYGVAMDLPGLNRSSHNVLVCTDGQHVLAIDPRTHDSWRLIASFGNKVPDFSWSKLTHIKKGSKCPVVEHRD